MYKLSAPKCPECGESPEGTVDDVPGIAEFSIDEDDESLVDWAGNTRMCWDGQMTRHKEGDDSLLMVQCREGHEWYTTMTDVPEEPQEVAEETEGKR